MADKDKETCVRCGSTRSVKDRSIPQAGGVTYTAKLCPACETELKAASSG